MDSSLLDEMLDGDGAMLLEPRDVFDRCVIGVAERINMRVAAYDTARVIEALVEHHGMEDEDAREYFEFNVAGSWVGEGSPVFIEMFAA